MRRTLLTTIVLAFSLSTLAGTTLAQSGSQAEPVPTPEASQTTDAVDEALAFAEPMWRKLAPGKGPAGREDHTWTVDAEGRFAYLFGGRDGDREFGDLWRYDLARDTWRPISVKGASPQPRFGHSAVWVEGQGMIVFAGQRDTDFFDDLWAFDPGKKRWRELPARGQVPKRRYGSCMVVGPDGRLWISHGFTLAGRFDDTRAYNLKSERWAVITPDSRKPGERCLHECFTSTAGELVLYGGQDDGNFALGDLWIMGAEREWDRRDDPPAAPRRLYGVTEAGDYAYVVGGAGEDDAALADLWRVDRETLEFERLRVEGNHPAARFAGTLITDRERGRLLLFGGQGTSAKSDTWELLETGGPDEESDGGAAPIASSLPEDVEGSSDL